MSKVSNAVWEDSHSQGFIWQTDKKYRIVYSEMCLHKCPQLLFSQEEKTVMKRGVLLANDTEQVEIPMQK